MARLSVSQPRGFELEVIALRHQLAVLPRQRPGRTRVPAENSLPTKIGTGVEAKSYQP
jgi:hypothetical protein